MPAAVACVRGGLLARQRLVEFRLELERARTEVAVALAQRGVGSRPVLPLFQPVERAVVTFHLLQLAVVVAHEIVRLTPVRGIAPRIGLVLRPRDQTVDARDPRDEGGEALGLLPAAAQPTSA